ncbi:alpha/beta hydrolase family protein [Paenibacillus sp. HJGM_3]|uniref:alpha/beta hydrolase family protein n=1 Tax=Paenibacillus sp. HJGM_3 TaxID=3379816 RepID=UPI00385F0051
MDNTGDSYPVLLMSPGFGVERDMYLKIIERLVNQRYCVVTIGAPYESIFTVYPDGQFIRQRSEYSSLAGNDYIGWQKLLDDRSQAITKVLEHLDTFNRTDSSFKGLLNFNNIAAIGHSLGGAAVFEVLKKISNIRAAVLLDPSLHLIKTDGIEITTPSLRQEASTYEAMVAGMNKQIASDYIQGQRYVAEVIKNLQIYRVSGAHHMSFSDVPVHYGDVQAIPIYDAIGNCITHFLDEAFNNNQSDLQYSSVDGVIAISGEGHTITR